MNTHPITGGPSLSAGVNVAQMTITPEVAEQVLKNRNTSNRPLSRRTVSNYARDMLAGAWMLNGDAIRFAHDGTLLDGQHRLAAIASAGIPVKTMVVWGLPRETQATMDDGRKRTMANVLDLAGQSGHTKTTASLLRRAILWNRGIRDWRGAGSNPTKSEMQDYLIQHPEILHAAEVGDAVRNSRSVRCAASTVALAYYLFAAKSPTAADEFFELLRTGVGLEEGSPILVLRNRLSMDGSERIKTESPETLAWFIKAWNAYRSGQRIKILRFTDRETFPEVAG